MRKKEDILKMPIVTRYNVLCFHIYYYSLDSHQDCGDEIFFSHLATV